MENQYLKAIAWRLLIVSSVPLSALFQPLYAGTFIDWVLVNPNESIFGACILCLFLGVLMGTFYESPEDSPKPIPLGLKCIISIAGGVFAFIWVLHNDKQLTLLNPLWVGAVSFLSPAIIQIAHTAGKERAKAIFGGRPISSSITKADTGSNSYAKSHSDDKHQEE